MINKQNLANFGGHTGRLLCCEWNALDEDKAVTGGDDMTIRMWKIKEQTRKTPAESIAVKTMKERKKTAFKPPLSSFAGRHQASSGTSKKKPSSKLKSLFPVSAALEARGRLEGLKDCKILATLKGVTLKHSIVEEDPESYTSRSIEKIGNAELSHLGFFASRESTVQMLQEEIDHHQEGSNLDLAAHLRIWQGDVESLLREAVKKRQLNEWLVSLAPQVSLE